MDGGNVERFGGRRAVNNFMKLLSFLVLKLFMEFISVTTMFPRLTPVCGKRLLHFADFLRCSDVFKLPLSRHLFFTKAGRIRG